MVENLNAAIVSSLESGFVSKELLALTTLEQNPEYTLILGPMAGIERLYDSYDPQAQSKFRLGILEGIRRY